MSKRPKFSFEEEKKIIDFVKNHEILFNVRNKQFRHSDAKNRLWLDLGKQLNKDAEIVKKKWNTMRDYFVRNIDKKTTGSAATITKRDKSLMFLLDISKLKRTTLSNISSSASVSSISSEQKPIEEFMNSTFVNVDDMISMTENRDTKRSCASSVPVFEETLRQSKGRTATSEDHTEILREFLNRKQPNPMDFLPQTPPAPKDNLHQFFESIASTMRTFPPLSIAKIKLEIAQIVGKEEIACAERNASTGENK